MADTKAMFTQRLDAARTALAERDERAAAESLRWAILAARSDPSLRRELASALFNLGKLSRKFGQAGEAEAGPLLAEALAINEEVFGSEDASLAPVLHELSRLHVQQSQHARAAEALERLLAIARVKGEEHPDVAVALSDLAFVKRKLGDDASAEALYRDALRIREKVLEPNHALTVGTLERLSETCAARGKFAEAAALLRRALPLREAALGADHERVRAARTRVVELESHAAAAASPIESSIQAAFASQIVSSPPEITPSSGSESLAAHREVVLADVGQQGDVADGETAHVGEVHGDWRSSDAPPQTNSLELAPKKRTVLYASTGAAAAAIAIVALLMLRPSAASGRDPASKGRSAAPRTSALGTPVMTVSATSPITLGPSVATMVVATHAESLRTKSAEPAPSKAALTQGEQHAAESARPELRSPRVDVHLDSAILPGMPVVPNADAILRSAIERQQASDTDRADTRGEVSRLAPAEVDNAHTSPRIIGRAPELVFPQALLKTGRREGLVVVRFMVNESGRVDLGSIVIEQSDHALFTDAVRDVLPRFRFEPAHTLGSDSKPVATWVSVPFRFTTKKK
jgi:TonB family protein